MVAEGARPDEVLEAALEKSGYLAELEASTDPQDESRVENLGELMAVAREFADERDQATVGEFLERVALVADSDQIPDEDESGGVVTLMTLHTAKGLEFPVVFLTGLEDGVFPHARALGDADRARGGASARLRRRHPRPRAVVPVPGPGPLRVGCAAAQPGFALPRRAAARTWSTGGAPRTRRRSGAARRRPAGTSRRAAPSRPPTHSPVSRRTVTPTAKPTAGSRPVPSLEPGDRVMHDSFGMGSVVSRAGPGRQGGRQRRLRLQRRQAPPPPLLPRRKALTIRRFPSDHPHFLSDHPQLQSDHPQVPARPSAASD